MKKKSRESNSKSSLWNIFFPKGNDRNYSVTTQMFWWKSKVTEILRAWGVGESLSGKIVFESGLEGWFGTCHMERATPGKGTSMWYGLESWEIKVSWGNSKWINLAAGEHCDSKGLAMFGNGGLKTAREGPHMLQVQSRMMGRVVRKRDTWSHVQFGSGWWWIEITKWEVVATVKARIVRSREGQVLWRLVSGWVWCHQMWAQWLLAVLRHWIYMAHLSFLVHYRLYVPLVMLP